MKRSFLRRKMQFMDKKMTVLYVAFLVISAIVIIDSPFKEAMTTLIAIVAALGVFFQTKKSADTARAEFILSLQQEYSSSEGFSDLFHQCWQNYNKEIDNDKLC